MVVTLKRIDVWSALRVGLIFTPIIYTLYAFMFTLGAGIGLGDYLGAILRAIIYGAAGAALAAWAYNAVSQRFGPLKLTLDVVHESQNSA